MQSRSFEVHPFHASDCDCATPACFAGRGLARGMSLLVAAGVAACVASPSFAGVKNWNIATGTWGTPTAWSPIGVPGPADIVFIGNTAAATNAAIDLTAAGSAQSITITDGMTLRNDGWKLTCSGLIAISGQNETQGGTYHSTLQITDSNAIHDVETGSLNIAAFGRVDSLSGGLLVHDQMSILPSGTFYGFASIILAGDTTPSLKNDGLIDLLPGFSSIFQSGAGLIDLDGDIGGELGIQLTRTNANPYEAPELRITAAALSDPMDDAIHLIDGARLNMELDQPWTLGANGEIRVFGLETQDVLARVQGAPVTVNGDIQLLGDGAELVFDAQATLSPSASAAVDTDGFLWFFDATVEGGTFDMEEGAIIRFSGPTTVEGGTFTSAGPTPFDGGVSFNGPTTYNGTVTINGYGIQYADASVVGPSVIHADTIDLDGLGSDWLIGHTLTVNADSIGPLNHMLGGIDLTGTLFGKLTINLPQFVERWTMFGPLKLGSVGPLLLTRIAGSPVGIAGTTTVSKAVQITAATEILPTASFTFLENDARLRFTQATEIAPATQFSGGGSIEVAASGSILLHDAADLGQTDLANDGQMSVADGPGLATVDRLTVAPTSTWQVEIGGYAEGSEHDQLIVNGASNALAGELDVTLLDLGDGHFKPLLGDVFTILVAPPASLTGLFVDGPTSSIPGATYVWSVGSITGEVAHIVTLTVADIIPCPADLSGDGIVDATDLAILLGAWGANPDHLADFNQDGMVAADDLAVLLGAWGACAGL